MRRALTKGARLALQAVLPAAILFGAWAWTDRLVNSTDAPPHGMSGQAAETVYAVTAADVALDTNRATFRAFGEVVARERAELRVASPGRVVDLYDDLAVGALVEAGTQLVRIDPFAYQGALRETRAALKEAEAGVRAAQSQIAMQESSLTRAEEQLAFAERDLERATTLRSGTIAPRAVDERRLTLSQRQLSVDTARFTLDAERARLDQLEAELDRLHWAEEEAARALEDTVLTAPFDGIVEVENAALGRIFAANDVAVTLVRADILEVRFVLSDERYGRLLASQALIGATVDVAWSIGDEPLTYTATVERIGAAVASDTGGVDVFARLDMPSGAVPRPGAFVEVAVPGRPHAATARLPAAALYGDHVYVIDDEERLRRRAVTLLARDGAEVIVRGALEDGDQVVTTRLAEAGEGLKVRRVELDDAGPGQSREPA